MGCQDVTGLIWVRGNLASKRTKPWFAQKEGNFFHSEALLNYWKWAQIFSVVLVVTIPGLSKSKQVAGQIQKSNLWTTLRI